MTYSNPYARRMRRALRVVMPGSPPTHLYRSTTARTDPAQVERRERANRDWLARRARYEAVRDALVHAVCTGRAPSLDVLPLTDLITSLTTAPGWPTEEPLAEASVPIASVPTTCGISRTAPPTRPAPASPGAVA